MVCLACAAWCAPDALAGPLKPVPSKSARSSHAPYSMGMCASCHVNKSKTNPGPVKKGASKTCNRCHSEMTKAVSKARFKHAPIRRGCTSCHNPHNSRYKHLLRSPSKTLCVGCHTSIKTALKSKVQHGPMTSGKSCVSCHDPHASNVQRLLLNKPGKLCLKCHSNHRVKDHDGKKLQNIRLLLTKNKRHHGPVRFKDCSACHKPHGSQHFRLLNEAYPASFYQRYAKKAYKLCFQCHNDNNITKAVSDVTKFRDGKRNLHYVHVVKPRMGRSCRACHETHASPQKAHVRTSVPYGSSGWKLEINFQPTPTGGRCTKTCHGSKTDSRSKK